jgi:hypothetical protein
VWRRGSDSRSRRSAPRSRSRSACTRSASRSRRHGPTVSPARASTRRRRARGGRRSSACGLEKLVDAGAEAPRELSLQEMALALRGAARQQHDRRTERRPGRGHGARGRADRRQLASARPAPRRRGTRARRAVHPRPRARRAEVAGPRPRRSTCYTRGRWRDPVAGTLHVAPRRVHRGTRSPGRQAAGRRRG